MTHKVSIHFCPKRYKIVKLYSRLSCVVGALESQIYLRVCSFGMIWIRIIDPRSLGSWYIKWTDESTMDKNSPVHYFDLLWSKWSQITDPDPDHIKGTHPKGPMFESCSNHLLDLFLSSHKFKCLTMLVNL